MTARVTDSRWRLPTTARMVIGSGMGRKVAVRLKESHLKAPDLDFAIVRGERRNALIHPEQAESGSWLEVAAGEGQESGPVGTCGVAGAVLAEGDVAVNQGGFHRWEFGRAQIPFAQKLVHRSGAGGSQEHSFGVHPAVTSRRRASADEDGARGAQS